MLRLGRTETYTYDMMGNLESTVDKEGNKTINDYDSRQRLISKIVKDAEGKDEDIVTTYTYNNLNELEKVNDKTYTFDTMSRITKIVDTGSLPNKSVTTEYGYRVDGIQTSTKISVGSDVKLHQRYSYDVLDRLSAVFLGEGLTPVVSYGYDNNGNRKVEGINGKVTYYTYNYNNQVTELRNDYQGKVISRYQYSYNQGGYQDGKTETTYSTDGQNVLGSSSTTYQYDLLGRLTKETTGNDSISYEYDKNAINRTPNIKISNKIGCISLVKWIYYLWRC